jgi:hypothetical protein
MNSLRVSIAVAGGVLVAAGCGTSHAEGSAVAQLSRVEAASDPELTGAAGQGAAGQGAVETEEAEQLPTDGTIVGLGGDEITGSVTLAAGSAWSGEIALFCCRDGNYSVYAYEGGRCSDPESWLVEESTRLAELSCSEDLGSVDYARDPSDASTTAFVIYDAAGDALGCADVAAE